MTFAVILAAGAGKRFGSEKQMKEIHNQPLYQYSVNIFIQCGLFDEIILVSPQGKRKEFHNHGISIIDGGKERYDSVKNALLYINNKYKITDSDKILIHDSARPLLKEVYIQQILSALNEYSAATLGYKITDALKIADEKGVVKKDVDRQNLWAVTTPQGFHLKKLNEFYQQTSHFLYDETHLFTENNLVVKIIETGRHNLKVTYPEDFEIATKLITE